MLTVLLRTIFAIVAGLLLVTGCARDPRTVYAAVKPVKDRKSAPAFNLKDASGKMVKLADYKGQVVLLNFWATWCGPCKIEIPWFKEFETTYKNKGFSVLGVAMDDEGWEIVKPYIESQKINYRTLMGTEEVGALYGGVESLPTSFVIDREGRIAAVHIGLVSKSVYVNDLKDLFDSPAGKKTTAVPGHPAPVLGLIRPN
jgi:cytochrome c biogenesis protein CcmG/thiol:disulfide interchange protein DsbE